MKQFAFATVILMMGALAGAQELDKKITLDESAACCPVEPNVFMERDLPDDVFPKDAKAVSAADLPIDFLQKAPEVLKATRKQFPHG